MENVFISISKYCCLVFLSISVCGQNNLLDERGVIDQFITDELYEKADSAAQEQIRFYKSNNLIDSLHYYPYYIGKLNQAQGHPKVGQVQAEEFVQFIQKNTSDNRTIYMSLMSLAHYYDQIAEDSRSLEVTLEALRISKEVSDLKENESGQIKYNLGACYNTKGNTPMAKKYFNLALDDYLSSDNLDYENLSNTYNGLGAMMWLSSKLDSAKLYFSKAVESIEKNNADPIENLYLSTVINANITLANYFQGDMEAAIDLQEKVIKDYQIVIQNSKVALTKSKALKYQINSISNLAVFYNEMGFVNRARDIIKYAYTKRKSILEPNDQILRHTLVQIGQAEISLKEYKAAIKTLDKALNGMKQYDDDNQYWKGAAVYAKAEALKALGKIDSARKLFDESEQLFEASVGEDYDREFLGFLRNKALFLSENNEPNKAVETAMKAFNYAFTNNSKNPIALSKHYVNVAQIHFNNGNFIQAKIWSNKGLQMISEKNQDFKDLNAVQLNFERPALQLISVQADFQLNSIQDVDFLKQKLVQLEEAILILNQRKRTIQSIEESRVLLDDYKKIYSFSKKVNLELYNLTESSLYVNNILNIHESIIYSRIRSQLNFRNNLRFANLPQKVLDEENLIKKEMASAFSDPDGEVSLESYYKSSEAWKVFNEKLKKAHPKYYDLKYGYNDKTIAEVQSKIPDNTIIVRYIFIEKKLYAIILDKENLTMQALTYDKYDGKISQLNQGKSDKVKTLKILHELYGSLWEPFEKELNKEHIIVIPDEKLFNLSFESLTINFCDDFKDLATESLLSKYILSYNYSLYLIDKDAPAVNYSNNFIGFAPEFNDKMKHDYKMALVDSISADKTYLTLLPQPYSLELAKTFSDLFDGTSYLNEKSTAKIFKQSAKEHKIIHIGTHGESNNISPELSRLIFAKDISDSTSVDDNSLYTFEIYNTDLSANLAILTACETGKPTYQAGEGMISLAHAFNYAGSESILTSLWKIDELSSAQIIKFFYKNLSDGMVKDEALQQAKLDFLESAEGRLADPQYWAGLVLIGDTSAIELSSGSSWLSENLIFVLLGLICLIVIVVALRRKKSLK